MQKIVPHLWYDSDAEAAARRYVELIPGSEIGSVVRYPEAGREVHGRTPGSVMFVAVRLGDTEVIALNGGPHFRFTPAISLFVILEDEGAVDRLWEGLIDGGTALMPLDKYEWSQVRLARRPLGPDLADRTRQHADVGRTVTPSLLFGGEAAGQAEAAIELYTSIFPRSRVEGILRHEERQGRRRHGQARAVPA